MLFPCVVQVDENNKKITNINQNIGIFIMMIIIEYMNI